MRRFLFVLFAIPLCLFIFPLTIARADEGWVIDNFSSNIIIQNDGKVQVSEVIDVDFGNQQKHGIIRIIPDLYKVSGKQILVTLHILEVGSNGLKIPFTLPLYKNSSSTEIRIGDPNKLVTGKVHYKIDYSAEGAIRPFTDYDELYWDVTGNDWPVPIIKSKAKVTLENGTIMNITCFEGDYGSNSKCLSQKSASNSASFQTTKQLSVNQGLTVAVAFPKGTFPILVPLTPSPQDNQIVQSRSSENFLNYYLPNIFLTPVFTGAGLCLIYFLWTKKGKDGAKEAIMVEYSPPANLRPAQLGTLMDESADTLDVAATIIDLAVRGYLTIEDKPKTWFLGKNDYILNKIEKENNELLSYEKMLLNKVFKNGNKIKISELKNNFYYDLVEIKSELYKNITEMGLFYTNPEKARKTYAGLSVLGLIAAASFFAFGLYTSIFISSLAFSTLICAVVFVPISKFMPKKTAKGYEFFVKGLGYKLFLEKVEIYKQKFLEDKDLFSKVMPYTIIFGITEKFAKTFDELGMKMENPNWYVSNSSFNYVMFSTHMNNFSLLMTSAIAYHAQSGISNSFSVSSTSAFSAGGGFSGGGFGGGGGGSW